MPDLYFSPPMPRPWAGLKDGGHVILRCSSCDKPLADVHVTRPQDEKVWRVRARCCYGCTKEDGSAETSFIEEVPGRFFHISGYSTPHPTDPDDCVVHTVHTRDEVESASDGDAVLTIEVAQWHPPT